MEANENRKFDRVGTRWRRPPGRGRSPRRSASSSRCGARACCPTRSSTQAKQRAPRRHVTGERRVVSLVPSVTETLVAWGRPPIACTRFCEQPDLPHVGGTKDPDVAAIVALAPDLVVMCEEENRREDAAALDRAGRGHRRARHRRPGRRGPRPAGARRGGRASPRGHRRPAGDRRGRRAPATGRRPGRAFVPIWRRPWMSLSGGTYGSSLLGRPRRRQRVRRRRPPLPRGDAGRGARRPARRGAGAQRAVPVPRAPRRGAVVGGPGRAGRRPGPVLVGRPHSRRPRPAWRRPWRGLG